MQVGAGEFLVATGAAGEAGRPKDRIIHTPIGVVVTLGPTGETVRSYIGLTANRQLAIVAENQPDGMTEGAKATYLGNKSPQTMEWDLRSMGIRTVIPVSVEEGGIEVTTGRSIEDEKRKPNGEREEGPKGPQWAHVYFRYPENFFGMKSIALVEKDGIFLPKEDFERDLLEVRDGQWVYKKDGRPAERNPRDIDRENATVNFPEEDRFSYILPDLSQALLEEKEFMVPRGDTFEAILLAEPRKPDRAIMALFHDSRQEGTFGSIAVTFENLHRLTEGLLRENPERYGPIIEMLPRINPGYGSAGYCKRAIMELRAITGAIRNEQKKALAGDLRAALTAGKKRKLEASTAVRELAPTAAPLQPEGQSAVRVEEPEYVRQAFAQADQLYVDPVMKGTKKEAVLGYYRAVYDATRVLPKDQGQQTEIYRAALRRMTAIHTLGEKQQGLLGTIDKRQQEMNNHLYQLRTGALKSVGGIYSPANLDLALEFIAFDLNEGFPKDQLLADLTNIVHQTGGAENAVLTRTAKTIEDDLGKLTDKGIRKRLEKEPELLRKQVNERFLQAQKIKEDLAHLDFPVDRLMVADSGDVWSYLREVEQILQQNYYAWGFVRRAIEGLSKVRKSQTRVLNQVRPGSHLLWQQEVWNEEMTYRNELFTRHALPDAQMGNWNTMEIIASDAREWTYNYDYTRRFLEAMYNLAVAQPQDQGLHQRIVRMLSDNVFGAIYSQSDSDKALHRQEMISIIDGRRVNPLMYYHELMYDLTGTDTSRQVAPFRRHFNTNPPAPR